MNTGPADALRRHRGSLERSVSRYQDTEVRFVLAIQTGTIKPKSHSYGPQDLAWTWDSLWSSYSRNADRMLETYSILEHPISKVSYLECLHNAFKSCQEVSEPSPFATIWSAVYVTRRGQPAALEFIQQAEKMVDPAQQLINSFALPLPSWVFKGLGHTAYGIGLRETAWFSLVCHLAKVHEASCSFTCWPHWKWDLPIEAAPQGSYQEHVRFMEHWDELRPTLIPGIYGLMPAIDARVASIETIDILLKYESKRQEQAASTLDNDRWITVTQASVAAKVNTGTIARAANEGKLRSNGQKKHARRIDAVDLIRWISEQAERPEPVESGEQVKRLMKREGLE